MAQSSSIEWTNSTWNPVTGCTKVSPGCKHCYAERMAIRLAGMKQPRYRNGFEVTLQPDLVRLPLRWRQPRVIFVNSMSDLFHEEIPESFIAEVFQTMLEAHGTLSRSSRSAPTVWPRLLSASHGRSTSGWA